MGPSHSLALTLSFEELTAEDLPRVGGKGRNLGALTRAGFRVPPGFCVTAEAFRLFTAGCAALPALYDGLDALAPGDVGSARSLGETVRAALLATPLPEAVAEAARAAWEKLGASHAYAVRSSATAEDLPEASFAGQQDTYLNVRTVQGLLDAVRRCFASLFTERAILYRARNGYGHRGVALSAVVQRMIEPDAAGILFTADPVTGRRDVLTIDAGFGLGEALVSGLVTADLYRVHKRTGELLEVRVGDKRVALRARPEGGTREEVLDDDLRHARVLEQGALRKLTELGVAVEAHYGSPQDLEWGLEKGELFLLQARPITSLYPLPEPAPEDRALHLYVSFGHLQNMMEPLTPLGLDVLAGALPFGKRSLSEVPEPLLVSSAGSRLYLDVTPALPVPPLRRALLGLLGGAYPDAAALVEQAARRPEARSPTPVRPQSVAFVARLLAPIPPRLLRQLLWARPEDSLAWAQDYQETALRRLRERLAATPRGAARLRAARQSVGEFFALIPHFAPRMGSGVVALRALRTRFAGTAHAEDVEALERGLHGNVTTEMDLRVGDLADLVRPHAALTEALRKGASDRARRREDLEPLRALEGGARFLEAFDDFLARYGMRGQGEIDVGRPRWREQPGLLLNSVLGNLSHPEAGAHRAWFERLQRQGDEAGERLRSAARGPLERWRVDRLVRCVRYGLGLREHPKFLLVQCLEQLREVVRESARELAAAGRLEAVEDVWFLRYPELEALAASPEALDARSLVQERKRAYERARHLRPPLVLCSDGEAPTLPRPSSLPAGALGGLGASTGVVEGLARVVLDPASETLHQGEILVAPYTDPGWTPLFTHAAGLVCDVGGMMTHGSVIAREYGIPAVVGVGDGTRRLRTGQRLRVDGGRGIVEVLEEPA